MEVLVEGVKVENLLVHTKGGDVPLRVEITDTGRLYLCLEVPRQHKSELIGFGCIAVAIALADAMLLKNRPMMRTQHLRAPGSTGHVNVPDSVEVIPGDKLDRYIRDLRMLLAGEGAGSHPQ